MITCKKTYQEIPFASRQPHHSGHCSFIHGHNWSITLTFACKHLDENGFVVDFGKLGQIKTWIAEKLDHAFVISESDPYKEKLLESFPDIIKPYIVPDASCEGLAEHFYNVLNAIVLEETKERAFITGVEVAEDSRNSAYYTP